MVAGPAASASLRNLRTAEGPWRVVRFIAWRSARWHLETGLGKAEARDLALGPVPVWIRAESVPEGVWDTLGEWFDLHPLALEDIRNARQRPKVEDYAGVTFFVARVPRRQDDDLVWTQVGIFLGDGFVLTACPEPLPELDDVERRLLAGGWPGDTEHLDRVFYHIVDALVDGFFPFMDDLEDRLDELEDAVLLSASQDELGEIRDIKNLISRTRKIVAPMREAVLSLERAEHPNVRPDTRVFLRDVSDHMVRISERLEHVREVALTAQETWNSTLANQQNQVMKRLTVVAALLLLPGLLAGLGGMNFDGIPDWDYWAVTGSILGFIAIGISVAWWQRWL